MWSHCSSKCGRRPRAGRRSEARRFAAADWHFGAVRKRAGWTNLITRALAVLANVSPAARRMSAPANAEHPLQLPPAANC
jgi:hypothetical protein